MSISVEHDVATVVPKKFVHQVSCPRVIDSRMVVVGNQACERLVWGVTRKGVAEMKSRIGSHKSPLWKVYFRPFFLCA